MGLLVEDSVQLIQSHWNAASGPKYGCHADEVDDTIKKRFKYHLWMIRGHNQNDSQMKKACYKVQHN
ncbi:hypothetical protein CEXT_655131 [Caerostris extrusa]|uniref:Uncharacterized protein n=1 Tax=Caerostris extrusa TaxID=172846 RepID=A0AAV4QXW9_CAEEX|nr:hypothetical protein CEXT_655131 [Caerostris extrusa]